MFLLLTGAVCLIFGVVMIAAEIWFERDWPRESWWRSAILIVLGLLILAS